MWDDDWLDIDHSGSLLTKFEGLLDARQLRLFACACCRDRWDIIDDENCRELVVAAEQFADGHFDDEKLARAHEVVSQLEVGPRWILAVRGCANPDPEQAAWGAMMDAAFSIVQGEESAWRRQCHMLRDIGGSLAFDPLSDEWKSPTVQAMAKAIYQGRTFEEMPILADALADAGCSDEGVVRHCQGFDRCPKCRGEGRLELGDEEVTLITGCDRCESQGWLTRGVACVRGCWVLDSILGLGS